MSQLNKLPEVARTKILQYLLVADNVRLAPDHLLIEHYDFETNVLLVNKAVHTEAVKVLYNDNVFVKIHCHHYDGETSMANHEVPFFKLTGKEKFDHHILDIDITPEDISFREFVPAKESQSYLMLSQDIPKLVRLLRILDVANSPGFTFGFKFRDMSGVQPEAIVTARKASVLLPFEQVRGVKVIHKVTITGPVDVDIASRVKKAMTQKVSWMRADAWLVYDFMLSIKRFGDLAFKLGNADMTLAKYDDARDFMNAANTTNGEELSYILDLKWDKALARLDITNWVDTALLMLTDMMMREADSRQYAMVPEYTAHIERGEELNEIHKSETPIPIEVFARFYHLLGIAELGLNHPIKAGKAFAKAYNVYSHRKSRVGWQTAKDWDSLSATDRQTRLDALLAKMPTRPFDIPEFPSYRTHEVESEKWIIRRLGFKGPLPHEDRISGCISVVLTTKPHPNLPRPGPRTARIGQVIPQKLQKHLNRYRKQMASPEGKGLVCRVGLKRDELGEESVLDDPGMAELISRVSASLRAQNLDLGLN